MLGHGYTHLKQLGQCLYRSGGHNIKGFAHLFGKTEAVDTIARIQAMADRNIRKYRLVDERRHG